MSSVKTRLHPNPLHPAKTCPELDLPKWNCAFKACQFESEARSLKSMCSARTQPNYLREVIIYNSCLGKLWVWKRSGQAYVCLLAPVNETEGAHHTRRFKYMQLQDELTVFVSTAAFIYYKAWASTWTTIML